MLVLAILVAVALLMASSRPWQFALTLAVLFVSMTWTEDLTTGAKSVLRLRNYYGIYRVFDVGNLRFLKHGTTEHGCEYLNGPRAGEPIGYYDSVTPDGEVLSSTNFNFKDIGMIGLGTGAVAAYFGEGQTLTVYELDPDNLPIADKYFTYLRTARKKGAKLSFVFGDGRISLRQVKDSSLDLLVVDAFNSGAIPVHLLTVEALEDYMRVLKRDGLLLMHVSNRLLDLVAVTYSNAHAANVLVCERSSLSRPDPEALTTEWVAMSRNHKKMDILVRQMDWDRAGSVLHLPKPWTDEYSDLLSRMWFK
jgi:SAM-dependent methyltransferase